MAEELPKLRPKQSKFVNEYLVDLNATQAAIRAGYSPKTARVIAAENLTKPNIQTALFQRRQGLASDTDVTPERVINELANIGFAPLPNDQGIKPTDKTKALDSLAKILGMFQDQNVNVNNTQVNQTVRFIIGKGYATEG